MKEYEIRITAWKTEAAFIEAKETTNDETYCRLYDENVKRTKLTECGNGTKEVARKVYERLQRNSGGVIKALDECNTYMKLRDGRVIEEVNVYMPPREIHVYKPDEIGD